MTEQRAELADRLRALLAQEPTIRERAMFGTRSFLVRDKLVACARRDGALLVRVAAGRHVELLARAGASQADMGVGRSMGPGWISVAPDAIAGAGGLSWWVDAALEHNREAAGDAR